MERRAAADGGFRLTGRESRGDEDHHNLPTVLLRSPDASIGRKDRRYKNETTASNYYLFRIRSTGSFHVAIIVLILQ